MKTQKKDEIIDVIKVVQGRIEFCILGTSPLICNRMSQKVQKELLLPRKKTAAERALTLKHNPMQEYRDSPYLLSDETEPTYIAVLATAFKKGMGTAALDLPGAKKTQVGRLVRVEGDMINIYGVPQLSMMVVRMADINRTPDIRTRAILPNWACRVVVKYVEPLIKPQAVANLLAAAGFTAGVGDGRTEKGTMNYGSYLIVDQDDPDFLNVVNTGGREAQKAAILAPAMYDDETAELLSWYDEEVARRQMKGEVARVKHVDETEEETDEEAEAVTA